MDFLTYISFQEAVASILTLRSRSHIHAALGSNNLTDILILAVCQSKRTSTTQTVRPGSGNPSLMDSDDADWQRIIVRESSTLEFIAFGPVDT